MQLELESIWKEVSWFCDKNRHACPPYNWTSEQTLRTLQQYPAGLTRPVLVTELEAKWRQSVRRGEHAGKLLKVLTTQQLELSEVISGHIVPQDDFRFRLVSKEDGNGGECSAGGAGAGAGDVTLDCIAHRQTGDFAAFTRHHGFDLKGHTVSLTNGRLLKQNSTLFLLPTPYLSYWLNAKQPATQQFLHSVMLPLHKEFLASSAHAAFSDGARAQEQVGRMNTQVASLFATVEAAGEPFPHPQASATTVLITRLALLTPPSVAGSGTGSGKRVIFLFLLDEQIALARLYRKGDIVGVYRPYVAMNSAEPLFGNRTQGTSKYISHGGSCENMMQYDDVVRPADGLEGALEDSSLYSPVHLWYGGITVVYRICDIPTGGVPLLGIPGTAAESQSQRTGSMFMTADGTPSSMSSSGADMMDPSGGGAQQQASEGPQTFLQLCHTQRKSGLGSYILARVVAFARYGSEGCVWLEPQTPYDHHFASASAGHASVKGYIHLRFNYQAAQDGNVKWPAVGQLLWLSGAKHDKDLVSYRRQVATLSHSAKLSLPKAVEATGTNAHIHVLPLTCQAVISASIGKGTGDAEGTGQGAGAGSNETGAGSETVAINVSSISCLLHSPTILHPINLRALRDLAHGQEGVSQNQNLSKMYTPGSAATCVIIAHVTAAAWDIATQSLKVLLCDESSTVAAFLSPRTLDLTNSSLSSLRVSSSSDVLHSPVDEDALRAAWIGQQRTFLLSRVDDADTDSEWLSQPGDASSRADSLWMKTRHSWNAAWLLNGASSTREGGLSNSSNSRENYVYFLVDAVCAVEPCAVAWQLVNARKGQ